MKSINAFRRLAVFLLLPLALAGCQTPPSNQPSNNSLQLSQPRYGHTAVTDGENIYVIDGANETGLLGSIEIIDPMTNKVTLLQDKLIPRRYVDAVWNGKESIYIFGGVSRNRGSYLPERTVEIFNTRTQEVTTTTAMPAPRRFNTAALAENGIYVVGGSTYLPTDTKGQYQLTTTPLVTFYDFATKGWHRLSNLPQALSTKVFVYQGKLCAVGGYSGESASTLFSCLDEQLNQWQPQPELPIATSAHSVAVHNHKLYVLGNYEHLTQTLIYDFNTQQWSTNSLDYEASRHNAAVVVNHRLYVIGGNVIGDGSALRSIQQFDLAKPRGN